MYTSRNPGAIVGVNVILGITMAGQQQPVSPLTHRKTHAMGRMTMPVGFTIQLKFSFQRQGGMEDNGHG